MYQEGSIIYYIILASFVMPLILSAILIWFFLAYQKKKHQAENAAKDAQLREQALIIEKQNALENERNRISSEMHDDLGSGLTRIRYLSDKALVNASDTEKEEITKISAYANDLVRNMGEIIWAMNSRFDNAESLAAYVRRYASEYLEEHNIDLFFSADMSQEVTALSGEKRRALFLVIKEILHNAVKYAGCSAITLQVQSQPNLQITLTEKGGRGFDPGSTSGLGNGLHNIHKRLTAIQGSLQIQRTDQGMVFVISA